MLINYELVNKNVGWHLSYDVLNNSNFTDLAFKISRSTFWEFWFDFLKIAFSKEFFVLKTYFSIKSDGNSFILNPKTQIICIQTE